MNISMTDLSDHYGIGHDTEASIMLRKTSPASPTVVLCTWEESLLTLLGSAERCLMGIRKCSTALLRVRSSGTCNHIRLLTVLDRV